MRHNSYKMAKKSKRKFRNFFLIPHHPVQKQYEALRAYYCENLTRKAVRKRFGYELSTFVSLVSRFESGETDILPEKKRGPKEKKTEKQLIEKIISLRKSNFSSYDIYEEISKKTSIRTIQRILKEEGFAKLPRRTNIQKGITKNGSLLPEVSTQINWKKMKPQTFSCQVAGIFLFVPYLLRLDIPGMIKQSGLPGTSNISSLSSVLSILALKLIGQERLSQIIDYNFDSGLGLFPSLNFLPKTTCITSYTYGIDKQTTLDLMRSFVKKVNSLSNENYPSNTINLDFHTIPHFGEKEKNALQKHWAGARNKRMTGALTFLAQDSESKMLNYCNTDLRREDASEEIINFVDFWVDVKGIFKGTLVFDSKLTTYSHLNDLNKRHTKFITLRRRGENLVEKAYNMQEDKWQTIDLKIPKRKFNKFKVYESEIPLKDYEGSVRQIIIKEHGRVEPTFVITNNRELTVKEVVTIYARRWRIENKIGDLVKFFSLNALNSPIMIRIFFDVLLTLIADCLYRLFAQELEGFEQMTAKSIFSKFIDTTGKIEIRERQIIVKLRRKSHSPILKSLSTFKMPHKVQWLGNRELIFQWKN